MTDFILFENVVRLKVSFYNASGVLTSPTNVSYKIKLPDGTTVTKSLGTDSEVSELSTGVMACDYDAPQQGTYHFKCNGSGNIKAAVEGHFYIDFAQADE